MGCPSVVQLQISLGKEIASVKIKILIVGVLIYTTASLIFLQTAFGRNVDGGIYTEEEGIIPIEVHEVQAPLSEDEKTCNSAQNSKKRLNQILDNLSGDEQLYILAGLTAFRDAISRPPSSIKESTASAKSNLNACYARNTNPDPAIQRALRDRNCKSERSQVNKANADYEMYKSNQMKKIFGNLDPATRRLILKIKLEQDYLNGECASLSPGYDCPACQ